MSELECIKCKIKSTPKDSKNIILCDICREYYCGECSGLNATEVRCMQFQKKNLIFNCPQCKEGKASMMKIEEKIMDQIKRSYEKFENEILSKLFIELKNIRVEFESSHKEILNKMQNEISSKLGTGDQKSYSTVASSGLQTTTNEVLVIKPREKQESGKTKTELKQKIDPRELSIAVENMKEVKGGAVVINCCDKKTKEKIKEKVENELENYKVEEGLQKYPKIIIRGIEEEFIGGTDQYIIDCIKEQNDLESNDIAVIKKFKQVGKRNHGNVILSVKNVALKEKICNEGKLNIGWRRCFVQEFFSVVRCFKCARYGHMAMKCENNTTCFKCSGNHKTSECESVFLKCINCREANIKFKKSLKVDHEANDPNCECYKRLVNLEARKTKTQ